MTKGVCKIREMPHSTFIFRFRQEPVLILLSVTFVGMGFLGAMTILSSVLRGFETVVLDPSGILFLFGFAAIVRLLAEATPHEIAFSEDGVVTNELDKWESILGVAILRQDGEYIELYIDLIRGTIPRRFRRGYFAGYVVEGSTDVSGIVEQYGGREKLIVVQVKE